MIENYQQPKYVQPSGATIALDLLATATTSTGTLTGGLYHIANSSWCHFTFDAAYKIQTIAVTPTEAATYTLTVGALVLTSAALGASPTLDDLVTSLQADIDYAGGAVTIVANATGITVTWKALGTQAANAVMTDDAAGVYSTVTVVLGGAAATVADAMLAAGERQIVIPNDVYFSAIKSTSQTDGVIRITKCE